MRFDETFPKHSLIIVSIPEPVSMRSVCERLSERKDQVCRSIAQGSAFKIQ
jgi:hypothetical protein